MRDWRVGLATGAIACALALVAPVHASAVPIVPVMAMEYAPGDAVAPVVKVQGGLGRFHGKRVQTAYCLKQNYWWFYRPYTTKDENFPRCEPYFHYPGEGPDYSLGLKPKPQSIESVLGTYGSPY